MIISSNGPLIVPEHSHPNYISTSQIGVPNGIPILDSTGKLSESQVPDDMHEILTQWGTYISNSYTFISPIMMNNITATNQLYAQLPGYNNSTKIHTITLSNVGTIYGTNHKTRRLKLVLSSLSGYYFDFAHHPEVDIFGKTHYYNTMSMSQYNGGLILDVTDAQNVNTNNVTIDNITIRFVPDDSVNRSTIFRGLCCSVGSGFSVGQTINASIGCYVYADVYK